MHAQSYLNSTVVNCQVAYDFTNSVFKEYKTDRSTKYKQQFPDRTISVSTPEYLKLFPIQIYLNIDEFQRYKQLF